MYGEPEKVFCVLPGVDTCKFFLVLRMIYYLFCLNSRSLQEIDSEKRKTLKI